MDGTSTIIQTIMDGTSMNNNIVVRKLNEHCHHQAAMLGPGKGNLDLSYFKGLGTALEISQRTALNK